MVGMISKCTSLPLKDAAKTLLKLHSCWAERLPFRVPPNVLQYGSSSSVRILACLATVNITWMVAISCVHSTRGCIHITDDIQSLFQKLRCAALPWYSALQKEVAWHRTLSAGNAGISCQGLARMPCYVMLCPRHTGISPAPCSRETH